MKLKRKIEHAVGAKLVASKPLEVGFGLMGLHGTLDDGREIAVKSVANEGPVERQGQLDIEGTMLRELKAHSSLPVPDVYHLAPDFLIMSWIENDGGPITPAVEVHAAELLAELHGLKFPSFGYGCDTLIGPLHQPNPLTASWIDFIRDQRLLYMARAAHGEGSLDAPLLDRLTRFCEKLPDLLTEPAHPSLIHGDLWTGNVLVKSGENGGATSRRIAGFVDPAIYCAHPEIELAFTTMFGTFGTAFFDAYETLSPLEPGFHDTRLEIYNLYPTLVHVRLFGSTYLSGIDRVLKRHGF